MHISATRRGLRSFGGKTLALAPYCRAHLCLWAAATPSISNGAPHRGPPHLLPETPRAQKGATTGAHWSFLKKADKVAGTICREGTGDASGADLRSGREEVDRSTRETIGYYDANAKSYVAETANVEFGALQREFARRLPRGGRVLDLGCGSGRDSLAFLRAGFEVDAVDGSAQMVEASSRLTGLPVAHALFEDFEPQGPYDGIWACSSLLHVPASKLASVIAKYVEGMPPNGSLISPLHRRADGCKFTRVRHRAISVALIKAGGNGRSIGNYQG